MRIRLSQTRPANIYIHRIQSTEQARGGHTALGAGACEEQGWAWQTKELTPFEICKISKCSQFPLLQFGSVKMRMQLLLKVQDNTCCHPDNKSVWTRRLVRPSRWAMDASAKRSCRELGHVTPAGWTQHHLPDCGFWCWCWTRWAPRHALRTSCLRC